MRGSVKQDENTKKWFVVFDVGQDPQTGKRKQKKKRGFKTKKEAQAYLNEQLTEVSKGTFFEPSTLTVKQYLEYWLEHVKAQVAPRTHASYSGNCYNHIIPYLGNIKLAKLQPIQAQKFLTELGNTGLANSSITAIHRIFKTALNQAVKLELLPRNPMEAVEKPRTPKTTMQVLNSEQVVELLQSAEGRQYHTLLLTAVYTGMRRGELLGLMWKDVDLEQGVIRVRQIAQRITGKGMVFGDTKTSGSRRAITIPQSVVVALKKEKVKQAEWKLKYGSLFKDNGLVFCSKTGKPVEPRILQEFLKRSLQIAGLPPIRFHDLRHTHATLLLQQGVHPKIVAERLGHANVGMTLDTYSHVLPNMQQEAVQKLDEALQRKIK